LKAIATKFRRLGVTADTPDNRERAQQEMLTSFFKSVNFKETKTKISLRTDDQMAEQEIELMNDAVDTSEPGMEITLEVTTKHPIPQTPPRSTLHRGSKVGMG
jgi:hypothetical protein